MHGRGLGGQPDRRSDPRPQLRGRLDRIDHLMQHRQAQLPCLDQLRESAIGGHGQLDLGALIGIERTERVFRGERVMILCQFHHANPRHARMSSMLRRSQVFTVLTGALKRLASCSRLHPL